MGTRDKDLIRILVSRSENDLVLIEYEFQVLFGKSLTQVGCPPRIETFR